MTRGAGWLSLLLLMLPAAAQTAGYSIAGRVVEAVTRAPMARTTVRINDYSGRTVVATAQTTAEGEFRFDGLARGKYSLYADHPVYGTQLFGTKLRGARFGSAVAVGPDLDSEHLVFQLIPGGVIKGVVRDLEPSMGAEDFSFMLQNKPGAYLRIGQGTGASGSALHNSRYDFNDDILPLGSALHASLIEQAMPLATP